MSILTIFSISFKLVGNLFVFTCILMAWDEFWKQTEKIGKLLYSSYRNEKIKIKKKLSSLVFAICRTIVPVSPVPCCSWFLLFHSFSLIHITFYISWFGPNPYPCSIQFQLTITTKNIIFKWTNYKPTQIEVH